MTVRAPETVEFLCDGPDCESTVSSPVHGPGSVPEGWLQVAGPSHLLGNFDFCSGACYDRWKVYAEQVAADYQAEVERRKQETFAASIPQEDS